MCWIPCIKTMCVEYQSSNRRNLIDLELVSSELNIHDCNFTRNCTRSTFPHYSLNMIELHALVFRSSSLCQNIERKENKKIWDERDQSQNYDHQVHYQFPFGLRIYRFRGMSQTRKTIGINRWCNWWYLNFGWKFQC